MLRVDIHSPWFWRCGSHHHASLRLFCVPCAGHGASLYCAWPRYLPPDVEVWALQPPGRENRLDEPAFTEIAPLVDDAANAMSPLLDRPYALVGHSMGALIAFELTRELRRRSAPLPRHLFVSGHEAPHAIAPGVIRHTLPDALFIQEVHALNGAMTEDADYVDAIRSMLPTLRADFQLIECYRYRDEPPLACDLSVWGGVGDPETADTPLADWRKHTTGTFSLRLFPGDHFFLRTATPAVLRALTDALAAQEQDLRCPISR